MSRQPRIWFPGAIYHVSIRGNRRFAIFYDDYDRRAFLEWLEETCLKYPFILHSYCLMTNHIHLQIETIDHHIKDIMKMLNSNYAIYFNKRHDLVGHVFQGRYRADIIDSARYFLEVSRYIHLNPVEAKIVNSPQDYPWSSYAAYITDDVNPHIVTIGVLSHFPEPAKEHYRNFVESFDSESDPHHNNVLTK